MEQFKFDLQPSQNKASTVLDTKIYRNRDFRKKAYLGPGGAEVEDEPPGLHVNP
jgi:hypothetical protein